MSGAVAATSSSAISFLGWRRRPTRVRPTRTSSSSEESYVTVADTIMSILCDEPRHITNPNTLIGCYFADDLPDISPDDQRPIDNESKKRVHTNAFSWRAILFSQPLSCERTSALQVSSTYGRVRYATRAADTGERISVSVDLQLEECLRPAYRRIQVTKKWCLVSLIGESNDERGPEAVVRASGTLEDGDEVLASIQVSRDRNMMLVGRTKGIKKGVLMVVSGLVSSEDDDDGGRWALASVDVIS